MRSERGFSLVEIMAALLILTFVITTSLYALLQRNQRLQQASEIVLAYQALANEAEFRRRDPFPALEGQSKFFDESNRAILAPLNPDEASVSVDTLKTGVKKVTMIVLWHGRQRQAKLSILRVDTNSNGGALF